MPPSPSPPGRPAGASRATGSRSPAPPTPARRLSSFSSLRLTLDDAALARKLAAARAYPEMAEEVERALAVHGEESFRVERLCPVDPGSGEAEIVERAGSPPYYETYGERQVAAGHYRQVLRLKAHFLPAAQALAEVARTAGSLA